jgi:GT2 family glycosyltransferase
LLKFVKGRKWLLFTRKACPTASHSTQLINCLYQAAFGRSADANELAHNIQRLQSGVSPQVVAKDLVRSTEFQARHGSGQAVDRDFVTALYRDGLGREPDSEGLTSWLAQGEKRATRAKVLAAFAGSAEALEKAVAFSSPNLRQWVNSLYKTAFGRDVDPDARANWIRQLRSGVSWEVLAEQIVASPEFQRRHGHSQKVDLKYLRALYRDGLGRQPDLGSLTYWLAEGEKGATRVKPLVAVALSHEAVERLLPPLTDHGTTYRRWVAVHDTISSADRAVIRAHISGLLFRPLISVVVLIRETSKDALRDSFNSVLTQLYSNWELCVAADDVVESLLIDILHGSIGSHPRIRMTRRGRGEGVLAAINAALSSATGEYVAFLRAGDVLAENALYEIAVELGGNPSADIVYTDHDQISEDEQRSDPWFKPGWDPDLLLAQDYISDLTVLRRELVEAVGLLRPGFEGAELHDLALRATAATTPDRIYHVPAILYHKRNESQEIHSQASLRVLYGISGSRRAVRDHLDSRGDKDAVLQPAPQIPSAIRVVWPLPEPPPLVSVIIPTRDRGDLLVRCVDGVLHRTDYCNLELLIVDNGSIEPATLTLFDRLSQDESRVRILCHTGPFNYSALNNAAAREAEGEVLLLLNNDVDVIDPGWLREMVSHAIRPDVGVVGAKLLYPNGQIQHGGVVLGPGGAVTHVHRLADRNDPGYCGQLALPRTLSAVTGACLAVRRAVFFEVGGLDEVNLPVAFNDIDFCLRVGDHGYRVVWTPFSELFHLESASRGLDDTDRAKREWKYMQNAWGSLLESGDPFHNPNLLFAWEYFAVPSGLRREKPWHCVFEEVLNLNQHFSIEQDIA